MTKLRDLSGLGPKSEHYLHQIGIVNEKQLQDCGAIRAYIKMIKQHVIKPNLNFLYALVAAIEGEKWLTIAKNEKGRLLMELEGYQELEKLLKEDPTS